jgi:hypothetical protein
VSNSAAAKLFMLAVHVSAVVGGIAFGVWVFDRFS